MSELNGNITNDPPTQAGRVQESVEKEEQEESPLQGLFRDLYGCLGGASETVGKEPNPMPGFSVLISM
jgi:hypothetical protein